MKLYWYSFSFTRGNEQGSTYMGYENKLITLNRITEAKAAAKMPIDSVLLSVCLLGLMTKDEFLNNQL